MIGSGAAGSVFASYLNKGGAELWLVDRYKAHMDKVAQSGMTFVTPSGEELLTGFRTAYSAENIGVVDMVILMVKATQTDGIMPSVMPCIGSETVVVSLQNGIGNDDVLKKICPCGQDPLWLRHDRNRASRAGQMRFKARKRRYNALRSLGKRSFFRKWPARRLKSASATAAALQALKRISAPSFGKRRYPTAATTPCRRSRA